MAEPLSSHEIEDVLSSIRRLVAQDLKPADRAKLAAVADISQKLMLTPENRVEDRGAEAPKFVTVRRPSRRAAFPAIDAVLPTVDATANRAPMLSACEAKSDQFDAPSAADYIAPQPAPFTLEPSARLSQVAPEEFAHQEFGLQDLNPQDDHGTAVFDPNDIEPVATTWAEEPENEEPENIEHFDTQVDPPSTSFHGTIEPDTDWADAAEAHVIAELAGQAVQDSVIEKAQSTFRNPSFAQASRVQDMMLDEPALRSLIQTIFREEMAGPIGERITRNIRKLVRAEVGRMLAAHELE